jgi:hypothetical protein
MHDVDVARREQTKTVCGIGLTFPFHFPPTRLLSRAVDETTGQHSLHTTLFDPNAVVLRPPLLHASGLNLAPLHPTGHGTTTPPPTLCDAGPSSWFSVRQSSGRSLCATSQSGAAFFGDFHSTMLMAEDTPTRSGRDHRTRLADGCGRQCGLHPR